MYWCKRKFDNKASGAGLPTPLRMASCPTISKEAGAVQTDPDLGGELKRDPRQER
jgi:hypothetical protein